MPVIDSRYLNNKYNFNINSVRPSNTITSSYARLQDYDIQTLFGAKTNRN
jgi:hypothetical protein